MKKTPYLSFLTHLQITASLFLFLIIFITPAKALDLDWEGQFRSEAHWILNYSLDEGNKTQDTTRLNKDGYYVSGGGSNKATFQTLFLKLRPKVIVNDNVYIKSEWWVGDPIFGFFGNGTPYSADQRMFYSNNSRGSTITAQRVWAEIVSGLGTVQVGRAPLHWGLGIVWNSGNNIFDKYSSTGDTVRLSSKLGDFTLTPAFTKYSQGNNIGGSCPDPTGVSTPCSTSLGGASVVDYSLSLKYENLDEDIELGLNFIRRLAGSAQDNSSNVNAGFLGTNSSPAGMIYNTWDIYGKKQMGIFTFAGEIPVTAGNISGVNYKTYALALESTVKPSKVFELGLKLGRAPGQQEVEFSGGSPKSPDNYKAFFFNHNYKIGLIMFNYQFRNFAGPNTENNPSTPKQNLLSPYDNPIVNADYIGLYPHFDLGKWKLRAGFLTGKARETAKASKSFYNTWKRKYSTVAATSDQGATLGWEMDYGATYWWDDSFRIDFDLGVFFPGKYYEFTNDTNVNNGPPVFASVIGLGINF